MPYVFNPFTGELDAVNAASTSTAYDPTTTYGIMEDFATAYTNIAQIWGSEAWVAATVFTGSMTHQPTTIVADNRHIGIMEFITGTNAAGGAGFSVGQSGGTATQAFFTGGGTLTLQALINIPTLSDGVDNAQINVGFRDGPGWNASGTNFHIQYQKEATLNWQLLTTAAGVGTTTNSSVPVTTGWHTLKVVCDATASNVYGYVDGVLIGTISTNIPTIKIPPFISLRKTLGTNSRYLGVDYIKIDKTFTTPR